LRYVIIFILLGALALGWIYHEMSRDYAFKLIMTNQIDLDEYQNLKELNDGNTDR
jgi:hypothetical protein